MEFQSWCLSQIVALCCCLVTLIILLFFKVQSISESWLVVGAKETWWCYAVENEVLRKGSGMHCEGYCVAGCQGRVRECLFKSCSRCYNICRCWGRVPARYVKHYSWYKLSKLTSSFQTNKRPSSTSWRMTGTFSTQRPMSAVTSKPWSRECLGPTCHAGFEW